MLIDLFIQAGWHTVPLEGKLERLPNGKKTPPKFEVEWKEKYSINFNERRVPLAGALTGKLSGCMAIDCDNQLTYDMFRSLDPNNNFLFISEGKPEGGGTMLYAYDERIGTFKLKTEQIALDFFSDDGFIYLPTEDNKTKISWQNVAELPELKKMPEQVMAMLLALKAKTPAHTVIKTNEIKRVISNRLAPMLEIFVKGKRYDPAVFKIITPYSFRDLPSYVTKGHLHPNDVPRGRGSEYLSKVSAILGADISVNRELYVNSIMLINSLWGERAKPEKELMSTIINPMIECRSTVDGEVIWQYDPHWEQMGFIATALNGDYLESFYDDIKGNYYLINYTVPYVKTFTDKRPVTTTLKTMLGRSITEQQYDSTKQIIRTALQPSFEFGHVQGTDTFNLFHQTKELSILNNPRPYKDNYVRPVHIIQYFESLIPDDFMRQYVLSFIKTKLTTFEYSPIVLYMIGKPGSGKDTLVNILATILGSEYITAPDTKVFLEQYNGWLIDKYFVHLDEYGNKLTRSFERQEALGKIKAYTGKKTIQIRGMRSDGVNYNHSTTFIMTANSNPLPVENEDRRFALINTPNKLATQDWVVQAGGVRHVVERLIPAEIMDFCYYLATEIPMLKGNDYVIAPETEDKEKLILDSMPAAERICFYIQNSRFDELAELAEEYNISNFKDEWARCRLRDEKLAELYAAMTEGQGVHRTVIRQLKGIGVSRSHTTKHGQNDFYYYINDLHKFADRNQDNNPGFEPQFVNKGIKGLDNGDSNSEKDRQA